MIILEHPFMHSSMRRRCDLCHSCYSRCSCHHLCRHCRRKSNQFLNFHCFHFSQRHLGNVTDAFACSKFASLFQCICRETMPLQYAYTFVAIFHASRFFCALHSRSLQKAEEKMLKKNRKRRRKQARSNSHWERTREIEGTGTLRKERERVHFVIILEENSVLFLR